ncbi:NAD-dependent epimerase/dehydratase family protein [Phycisphaerales bacterium AB-hyl4]|uniref:NAD-dependent epimerase/dehydratase family protein n=1 Tax=Natronomicrosphaera hydrolytica TaxID=3242702 RepID=A0ABV4U421_9BACT
MNVLIVGGAGHVGSIIRPALEQTYNCRYLDLKPVPGAEDRTFVGDVNDTELVDQAVQDQNALLYLAMGKSEPSTKHPGNTKASFDVNVCGFYQVLRQALKAGVRQVCMASSLSVYKSLINQDFAVDEQIPADHWGPYGFSKRVAEFICQAAVQEYPDASILALRLIHPQNEEGWAEFLNGDAKPRFRIRTGPEDTRRLFLKALEFNEPGCHILQATGDMTGERLPNHLVREILGWEPQHQ